VELQSSVSGVREGVVKTVLDITNLTIDQRSLYVLDSIWNILLDGGENALLGGEIRHA
jgi:hypothetical protein